MKQILSWKKIPLLFLACGVVLTVAFAQSHSAKPSLSVTDTIPQKQKKIRNLDDALAEIDRSELEMQRAMKEIDHATMEQEISEAMKHLDIDMKKMKVDVDKAIKEIDMAKISSDVEKALKEINMEEIRAEVQASLSKVDMAKVKAEIEKVKEIDVKKLKEEMAAIQPQIEKAMKEAKVDIEKARKEIRSYKNLVDALEKDGLLKSNDNYRIDYKNNSLTVNGTTLSAEATKKYSEFLKDKKAFRLKKHEDGLEINH